MHGVPADIARHNLFAMVRIERPKLPHHLNLSVKKAKRPIYVPVRKPVIRPIVMGRIKIKKELSIDSSFLIHIFPRYF